MSITRKHLWKRHFRNVTGRNCKDTQATFLIDVKIFVKLRKKALMHKILFVFSAWQRPGRTYSIVIDQRQAPQNGTCDIFNNTAIGIAFRNQIYLVLWVASSFLFCLSIRKTKLTKMENVDCVVKVYYFEEYNSFKMVISFCKMQHETNKRAWLLCFDKL